MVQKNRNIPEYLEDVFIDIDQDYFARHEDLGEQALSITIQSSELEEFCEGKAGAEFRVLAILTKLVVAGLSVDGDFQKLVNVIVAKSILRNKLPAQPKSRPKARNGVNGQLIASKYIELREGGAKYAEAVAELAGIFFKDERQIMRIVKENRVEVDALQTLKQLLKTLPALGEHIDALETMSAKVAVHKAKRSDPAFEALELNRLVAELNDQIDKICKAIPTAVIK